MSIITVHSGRGSKDFKAYQDDLREMSIALRVWMREYQPASGRELTAYDKVNVLNHVQGIELVELYNDLPGNEE